MDGLQVGESRLELDNLRILEADPLVQAYYPQPTTLHLGDDEESRRYTPDVLVRRHDGACVVEEVKLQEEAAAPSTRKFHEWLCEEFQARGYRFVVKTEREIQNGPALRNAYLLLAHRSTALAGDFLHRLADAFLERPVWTMAELRLALREERWNSGAMLNAIRCRHAIIDISLPLTANSSVCAPTAAADDLLSACHSAK